MCIYMYMFTKLTTDLVCEKMMSNKFRPANKIDRVGVEVCIRHVHTACSQWLLLA